MAQTAWDAAMSTKILNATLPTGASGVPGTSFAALGGSAMKLKLFSTASTGSSAGTELTGTGYTTGGTAFSTQSAASSAGSNVTCPHTTAISWTNGSGSSWTIVSLEIVDSTPLRVWFGAWNGQPITVANGNTFQVAAEAISAGGM
jgi:hypothetical protein